MATAQEIVFTKPSLCASNNVLNSTKCVAILI